jgi:gamma-glutamyl:cysteine ligase YbdK (ATP-grasp superfamily)
VGRSIDQEEFDEDDYSRFRDRLEECLRTLGQVLERPGFGEGPRTIGAELELVLVDGSGNPLPQNQAVHAAVADRRVTFELHRFNLELNATPVLLADQPFTALGAELRLLLDRVGASARIHGGQPALIGILPTLSRDHLTPGMMTDAPRYRALSRGLQRMREGPFRIQIMGADPLDAVSDDVGLEGANTSFQVHLRVNPAEFSRVYNAVQLASGPALAASGNSPTFLGHRLWEETRIALYKQSVDDRPGDKPRRRPARTALGTGWLRGGAADLFAESVRLHQPVLPVVGEHNPADADRPLPSSTTCENGGAAPGPPPLHELRLHQSTVWRWNRAIYDPAAGGHLRIEMRALPAGPTVIDMLANSAFLIGASLWLAEQDQRWTFALPFERADYGFYRAAQYGLTAQLSWPTPGRDQIRTLQAAELIGELIPAARQGLLIAGVPAAEADSLLDVISQRTATGQTGSAWQRATLAVLERERNRHEALVMMLERYLKNAATGAPVHTWPVQDLRLRFGTKRPSRYVQMALPTILMRTAR